MTQTTLREYLRTTEDAISSGRIDEAMANCQNILTYFPEALEAQRLLGEVYLAQGQLDEAQQTFEWILTNDPENVIVYCDRALISERVADIDTALDCYQQAYELSRGSANIRQEFNQLSARAGQQEFMFSRAGLARLYMRGDLLTQAIQEWDAVLAISPDRLDARLGLMETYWREGLYSQAESIATLLLEEIPTCLKALLYLAHIASISNIQRARELLQRAEALDPDLRMAQEVFADLSASQPNDPFLELIKKEPLLLEDGVPVNKPVASAPSSQPAQAVPAQGSASPAYGNWNTPDNWSQQAAASPTINQSIPETPSHANWNSNAETVSKNGQNEPATADWQTQLQASSTKEQPWYQQDQFSGSNSDPMQHWENLDQDSAKQPAWQNQGTEEEAAPPAWLDTLTRSEQRQPAEPVRQAPVQPVIPPTQPIIPPTQPDMRPAARAAQATRAPQPVTPAEEEVPFFFSSEDGESEGDMGWPEWLKSLGAAELEPESPEANEIAATPEPAPTPIAQTSNWEAPQQAAPDPSTAGADPWESIPALSANNDAWSESNSQSNWMQQIPPTEHSPAQSATPDWMQQLSPAEYSSAQPTQAATPDWMQQLSPAAQVPAQPSQTAAPDWMHQLSPVEYSPAQPAQAPIPDWMQQIGRVEQSPAQPAQAPIPDWMQQPTPRVEQSPVQAETPDWMQQYNSAPVQDPFQGTTPNWMQQLSNATNSATPDAAQEQGYLASLEELEKNLQNQGFVPLAPGALASIAQTQTSVPPPAPPPPAYNEVPLSSALAQLGNFPQPAPAPNEQPWWNANFVQNAVQSAPATNPFTALGARTEEETRQGMAPLPATPLPFQALQGFGPSGQELPIAPVETTLTPAYRSDALLDSDLETTMKRPAIKLQPMQALPEQGDRAHPHGKGRSNGNNSHNERKPIEHVDESNLGSHERLVRGYQYQLSGAYDEAMQEYRLIIRNAPELLDDVISNMRALLKLNPRFSLGYRVLGDAYMRKGEYLQAMESYNKALTMAKKSRN